MSEDIVTKLKAEGNVAFGARDFEEAHSKYTQAIALDDSNAVLFANRAACSLHMGRLLDAASDSEQATSIDPKYAKAWARLATADAALNNCSQSAKSWQKALDCLPSDNLSPGELRQKEEFTAGLRSAQARGAAFDAQEFKGVVLTGEQGSHPWDVAKTMRPELERLGGQSFVSSAWVILEATEEFEKGVEAMKQVKFIPAPNGQQRMVGRTDALELISNGILRDERVFRMDCSNWIELYNKQVLMEVTRTRAWVDAGPEKLQEEALKRLRQEGWDAVRPVLATTIRVWVMRGFLEGGLKKEDQASVEYLTRALEVLNRGRQVWRNVTKEKRGVIFEDTFVRVVRSMRLHAYMEAYSTNGRSESPFSLEHLLEEAEDILRDIDEHPPAQTAHHTQGAVSSFWKYPRGRALAMKGFYHAQKSDLLKATDILASMKHCGQAGTHYLEAAGCYPEDDEQRCYFLHISLNHFFVCSLPTGHILGILEGMQRCFPKMQRLWKISVIAQAGRDDGIKNDLHIGKQIRAAVERGEVKMDACYCLQPTGLTLSDIGQA